MLIKNAIITALITWTLIVAIAAGIVTYRQDVSVKSALEYIWGISFVFAVIGFLLRGGATGDTVERTEGVVRSSYNREGYLEEDGADAVRGFAFGTIVMLSALTFFGGSLAVLYFSYPS